MEGNADFIVKETNDMKDKKEMVYNGVLGDWRHYSAVRVSLILFFWSAAGFVLFKGKFCNLQFGFFISLLILGVILSIYFQACTNACWRWLSIYESENLHDEDNTEVQTSSVIDFHFQFPPKLKKSERAESGSLWYRAFKQYTLDDITFWFHSGISLVYGLTGFFMWSGVPQGICPT